MKVTLRSAKIIERMINQNTFDEINHGRYVALKLDEILGSILSFFLKTLSIGKMMQTSTENKKELFYLYGSSPTKKLKNFRFVVLHGIQDMLTYLQSLMDRVNNIILKIIFSHILFLNFCFYR